MRKSHTFLWLTLTVLLVSSAFPLTGCSFPGAGNSGASTGGTDAEIAGTIDGIVMDESAGVVAESVCDVFEQPDVKTNRITQVFYNQPVEIRQKKEGWYEIKAADGSIGWIKSKYILGDVSSIYGRSYTHRIIITSREKSIFSSPSGGVTLKEAVMGTEFVSFNENGESYEVYLPGDKTGWLGGSGMIHVEKGSDIAKTSGKDFAATAKKFKGMSYLLNGLSSQGIDSAGITYVCARINGIKVPRYLEGQAALGNEAEIDNMREGDILFFYNTGAEVPAFSGIVCDSSQIIFSSSSTGYVKVTGLTDASLQGYDIKVRRLFDN
ncbi:MAG: C40 family peptidase [Clostridiales bacterium]|nr:C40 family peptidase [Clostridiales bacterium]